MDFSLYNTNFTLCSHNCDVEDAERGAVIDYLKRRFGQDHVAQVSNIVKYSIKSAFQDAARIYGIPAQQAISISKSIDEENWNESPYYDQYKDIFKFSETLLGQMRNFGRHAAAVVITDKPVYKYVPVQYNKDDDILLTEYPGESVTGAKLLKLDILGLSTLKILKDSIQYVKERHGIDINLDEMDFDDPEVFKLFSKGLTTSVFQFESASMKGYLQQLKPQDLEDITAMNALFRPGSIPIINNYIRRRHGKEEIKYDHPILEKVLKPTYGLLIYQEQTIMIAHLASGMSLGKADILRRYLEKWNTKYKNDVELKKKLEKEFIDGCLSKGLSRADAKFLWEYLIRQSGYSFNRCFSGDCVITSASTHKWRPTIREMYKIKNDSKYAKETKHYPLMKKYRSKKGYGKSFSLYPDKLLRTHEIVDIYYEGEREVFEIELESGDKIEVTKNHKFPLTNGKYKSIEGGLSVGNELYVLENFNYKTNRFSRIRKSQKGIEPGRSKIKSIRSIGVKDTYNVEMKAPYHTLTVNNIVTSNSHSLSYAIIAYYTAWMKVHYPVEFMCASLNSDKTPLGKLISECKQLGIEVLYPDINKSQSEFSIVDDHTIVYGLSSVKNCGEVPSKWISAHAPYNSVDDFFDRLSQDKMASKVNKRVLDSLIMAGAFDSIYNNRKVLLKNYQSWYKMRKRPLFDDYIKENNLWEDDFTKEEKMKFLVDLLTLDISSIIIEENMETIDKLQSIVSGNDVVGVVSDFTTKRDKNGNMMAFVSIRDKEKVKRYPMFSRQFASHGKNIQLGKILIFRMINLRGGDKAIGSIIEPDLNI